jgi:hypothetical protein
MGLELERRRLRGADEDMRPAYRVVGALYRKN